MPRNTASVDMPISSNTRRSKSTRKSGQRLEFGRPVAIVARYAPQVEGNTMPIYQLDGRRPVLPPKGQYWIAPGARVMGNVILHVDVSIWFNAVLRGDNEAMTIGAGSNVQDGSVLHSDPGFPLTIGANCTVGHAAIIHGCTIGDNTLIGMGATILNGAKIGNNCLVGANSLVTEGKVFPDNSLIVGSPARSIRTLDAAAIAGLTRTAQGYVARLRQYSKGLQEVEE
jgi:carbonic anhydrase/acetyltransferase-like protein (isoleucine patch superfamily)